VTAVVFSSSLFFATRWSGLAQFVSSNRKASETKQQSCQFVPRTAKWSFAYRRPETLKQLILGHP